MDEDATHVTVTHKRGTRSEFHCISMRIYANCYITLLLMSNVVPVLFSQKKRNSPKEPEVIRLQEMATTPPPAPMFLKYFWNWLFPVLLVTTI